MPLDMAMPGISAMDMVDTVGTVDTDMRAMGMPDP